MRKTASGYEEGISLSSGSWRPEIGSVETRRGWMQKEVSMRGEEKGKKEGKKEDERGKKRAAGVGTIQPFKGRALKFFNSNITTDDAPFLSSSREKILCISGPANGDTQLSEELHVTITNIPRCTGRFIIRRSHFGKGLPKTNVKRLELTRKLH